MPVEEQAGLRDSLTESPDPAVVGSRWCGSYPREEILIARVVAAFGYGNSIDR
jgi:hypothetical protein